MTPGRLTAIDARLYWLSTRIPLDQFVLLAFDGEGADDLVDRARSVDELRLRLRETPGTVDHPYWVPMEPTADHVRSHSATDWAHCLDRVGELIGEPVDPRDSPWRMHVFTGVAGVPRCGPRATVIVLQISHALADGRGSSRIARAVFGGSRRGPATRRGTLPAGPATVWGVVRLPAQIVTLLRRGRAAATAARDRACDTASGSIPAPAPARSPGALSRQPTGRVLVRCVSLDRTDVTATRLTATVFAALVVSLALPRYLTDRGLPVPDDFAATTTVAIADEARTTRSANAFHTAGVDLHPSVADLRERAVLIARSLDERRRRLAHGSFGIGDLATDATPAWLVRRDVRSAELHAPPRTVDGHTVLSSVFRGPADLTFGGAAVAMTAGFPALSPAMGVTHGVHGIGDAITLSIVSTVGVMADIDEYAETVRAAAERVRRELGCARNWGGDLPS